jgi:hypothetical protein
MVPNESYETISSYLQERKKETEVWDGLDNSEKTKKTKNAKKELKKIKGFLCDYPVGWLKNENYKKDIALNLVNDYLFI